MTAKQKKLFLLTSMMSVFVMAVAVLFAGGKVTSPLSRVLADQAAVTSYSMDFNKSNSVKDGATNTTVGYTKYNAGVVCKVTGNDTTYSSGYVGAVKSGSSIHFYESDGVTEYLLEDMRTIKMTFTNASNPSGTGLSPGFNLYGFYATGETFAIETYSESTKNSTRTINFNSGDYNKPVSRIYVTFKGSTTYRIESISLIYNCTPKYQTGVSIGTAPTKTVYAVGSSFDPSGMIIFAQFSSGQNLATDRYSYYPTGPLTVDDEYVTISCGGFTVNQSITVSNAGSHAVGTYKVGSYEYYIYINDGGTGYIDNGGKICDFEWTYDGSNLNFVADQIYNVAGSIFYSTNIVTVLAANITLDGETNNINTFKVSVKTPWSTSNSTCTRQ